MTTATSIFDDTVYWLAIGWEALFYAGMLARSCWEPLVPWERPPSAGPLALTCSLPGAAQPGGRRARLGSNRRAVPGLRRDGSHVLLEAPCAVGEASERGKEFFCQFQPSVTQQLYRAYDNCDKHF